MKTRLSSVIFLGFIFSISILQISMSFTNGTNESSNTLNQNIVDDLLNEPTSLDLENDLAGLQTSSVESNRILFYENGGGSVQLPVHIDLFNYFVNFDTRIDLDWKLWLPIDVSVQYNNTFLRGESKDLEIQMSLPEDQARLRINTSVDFDIAWNIPGVDDGSASLIDYELIIDQNFTTPIGKYNLPFSYKYGIPVSIYGVPLGTLYIIATPQIIPFIKAEILSNPDFQEAVKLKWEKEGNKTISLTAKMDASTGMTTIELGNFQYAIALGIEWAIEWEFVKPFDLIYSFLEQLGFPELKWVIGTWPKIEIGHLSTDDKIDLDVNIFDLNETGNSPDSAIGFDVMDWWKTSQNIALPGTGSGQELFYTFKVQEGWQYDFQISSVTDGVNVDAVIYDDTQTLVQSTTYTGAPTSLSFTANSDGNYYLEIDPNSGTSCTATVQFTDVRWPGKTRATAIQMTHPYDGYNGVINGTGYNAWFKFSGTTGDRVAFWNYEFHEADNLDLYLFYNTETISKASSASATDNPETLEYPLDATGDWYLSVNGTSIDSGNGSYWLDYGLSAGNTGFSNATAIHFNTDYEGDVLGTELDTQGGLWVSTTCTVKQKYTFIFNGEPNSTYDFILYDTDKSTVIWKGKFTGDAISLPYGCLADGEKYIHVLPYHGGYTFNITKSAVNLYYPGEDAINAQTVDENFLIEHKLPTDWGSSKNWNKVYLTAGTQLLLKLNFAPTNNYDLYLYHNDGAVVLAASYAKNPEVINYDIITTGWYKILVDQYSGSGAYNLSVGTAVPLTVGNITSSYSPSNMNDYYYVNLNAGDTLNISLECVGYRSAYVDLILYDGNMTEIASDLDGSTLSLCITVNTTGVYYFRISNPKMGDGSYLGTVSIISGSSNDAIIIIATILGIMIPSIIGIVLVTTLVARKKKYGIWLWQERNFKMKVRKIKRNVSKGSTSLKDKLVLTGKRLLERGSSAKDSSKNEIKDIIKMRVAVPEEIKFEESFAPELKANELDYLKNVQTSTKSKDKSLKKLFTDSKEEIEFEGSYAPELKDNELNFLKNVQTSTKSKDKSLKKLFADSKEEKL